MPGKDIEWQRYNVSLPDGGPFYADTNTKNFIVEPWNALSSLFFLIPAIYWAYKIKNNFKENGFLVFAVPLLILGGLGSTFFHAFRSSELLLWMDVLPILILTIGVSTYFWHKVVHNIWITIGTMILSFLLRRMVFTFDSFSVHTANNISYAIGGITIFLPILLIMIKTGWRRLGVVVLSMILFMLSLFFREIDARSIHSLSMGTHFLWHLFSAAGTFYLAEYLYFIKGIDTRTSKVNKTQDDTASIANGRQLGEAAMSAVKVNSYAEKSM